ncbi:MAG: hypothetical protein EOR57_23000 [Mesorhizobium sp.]|uniref:hypothetical protein n=1 Tax=Mesorhizobium sp. TaxID=1871066 RepID=UPI000FE4BC49|nr:hypothetical protein [Mesorhizobium sp.]RWL17926.1 MAG: hypothetical protein EOR57_23000 [Mesorhizobium sp.]
MNGYGFLAIWTDIDAEHLSEYRRWLSQEHIGQRIFGSGFLGARVHAAIGDELSHFILYATEDSQTLQSDAYLHVLNNPTPWTQRMMPRLRNFDRGAGIQVAKVGDGSGAWLLACRIFTPPLALTGRALEMQLGSFLDIEGVVTVRLLVVDRSSTDIPSTEKAIRSGNEGAFHLLLVVEATAAAPLKDAQDRLAGILHLLVGPAARHDAGLYQNVYSLFPFERETTASSDFSQAAR